MWSKSCIFWHRLGVWDLLTNQSQSSNLGQQLIQNFVYIGTMIYITTNLQQLWIHKIIHDIEYILSNHVQGWQTCPSHLGVLLQDNITWQTTSKVQTMWTSTGTSTGENDQSPVKLCEGTQGYQWYWSSHQCYRYQEETQITITWAPPSEQNVLENYLCTVQLALTDTWLMRTRVHCGHLISVCCFLQC